MNNKALEAVINAIYGGPDPIKLAGADPKELAEYAVLIDRNKGVARLYSNPEVMRLSYLREKYPEFEQRYLQQSYLSPAIGRPTSPPIVGVRALGASVARNQPTPAQETKPKLFDSVPGFLDLPLQIQSEIYGAIWCLEQARITGQFTSEEEAMQILNETGCPEIAVACYSLQIAKIRG